MSRRRPLLVTGLFLVLTNAFLSLPAFAAPAVILPGPADIDRIRPEQPETSGPVSNPQNIRIPASPLSPTPVPKGAKKIHFVLRDIIFEHVTVFSPQQLKELYEPYVGKKVTVEIAWKIAAELTEKYRQHGYFLSRAFVPAQEIVNGTLKVVGVEGYISEVSMAGDAVPPSDVIGKAIDAIKADRPTRTLTLERQLLLLNDLPGLSFQATIAPAKDTEAAAQLILTVKKTKGTTTLSFDNGGSRYLGPNEVSAAWSGSLLSMQQTDLFIQSAPAVLSPYGGALYTTNATQKIVLAPSTILDFTAGYTNAVPGYTLKVADVTSQATNGGIGISSRILRQREENLTLRLSMDFRNSDTDISHSVLSRDRIRAANFGVNYDNTDSWLGHNYLDVELRQGLPIIGSSTADDTDLSRPDINPDFTKLLVNYSRLQTLTADWSSSLSLSGQKASGPLYSSEEFGYGGMAIGRAYDTSEISGDDGISGSLELRYQSVPQWHQITLSPYAFYDIGKVWDLYPSDPEQISAASAGPGMRVNCVNGLSGNFYIADPLTKTVDTPIYGDSKKAPRYAFQVSYKF